MIFCRWLAPELMAGKPATFKCDIYSLVVVFSELLSNTLPWKIYDVESIRHQVVTQGKRFPIPPKVSSKEAVRLIEKGSEISRRKRNLQIKEISECVKHLMGVSLILVDLSLSII